MICPAILSNDSGPMYPCKTDGNIGDCWPLHFIRPTSSEGYMIRPPPSTAIFPYPIRWRHSRWDVAAHSTVRRQHPRRRRHGPMQPFLRGRALEDWVDLPELGPHLALESAQYLARSSVDPSSVVAGSVARGITPRCRQLLFRQQYRRTQTTGRHRVQIGVPTLLFCRHLSHPNCHHGCQSCRCPTDDFVPAINIGSVVAFATADGSRRSIRTRNNTFLFLLLILHCCGNQIHIDNFAVEAFRPRRFLLDRSEASVQVGFHGPVGIRCTGLGGRACQCRGSICICTGTGTGTGIGSIRRRRGSLIFDDAVGLLGRLQDQRIANSQDGKVIGNARRSWPGHGCSRAQEQQQPTYIYIYMYVLFSAFGG